jgi:hypothetical protein
VTIRSIVVGCILSSVAFAQPGTDGNSEPPPPPPEPMPAEAPPPPPPPQVAMPVAPPAPVAPTVDRGIIEDANAGRSWIAPTALTEPAGTWSFSDFELLAVSLAYSFTDQLSISATSLLPIVEDMPFFLLLNGKFQVVRSGNVRIAAQGAITHVRVDGDSATAGVIGGALTYCIDDACHSTVTGYVGAGIAHEDQSAVPLIVSGALALRAAKHVKVLIEADTGYIAGEINAAADGFLGWYGVRFTSSIIGVDLGFAKPFCDGCSDTGLPMGVPFVSFTYRSLK